MSLGLHLPIQILNGLPMFSIVRCIFPQSSLLVSSTAKRNSKNTVCCFIVLVENIPKRCFLLDNAITKFLELAIAVYQADLFYLIMTLLVNSVQIVAKRV